MQLIHCEKEVLEDKLSKLDNKTLNLLTKVAFSPAFEAKEALSFEFKDLVTTMHTERQKEITFDGDVAKGLLNWQDFRNSQQGK